jgi:hypothetical protein
VTLSGLVGCDRRDDNAGEQCVADFDMTCDYSNAD